MLVPLVGTTRAARADNPMEADDMRRIAGVLEETPTQARLIRIFRKLYRDYGVLRQNLERAGAAPKPSGRRNSGRSRA